VSNATKSAKTTGAEAEEAESEPLIERGRLRRRLAPGPRLKNCATTPSCVTRSRPHSAWRTSWRSPASPRSWSTWAPAPPPSRRPSSSGSITDLTIITGQKPIVTKAKKSIAGFKLREGNAIGVKVTLRGDRMWEFFDRLVNLAIPRIRDFRGLSAEELRRPG
jgi:hypothetical protein